jgi:hypothetical protein
MALLNREAYTVEKDKLVYDGKHPFDVANVPVKVTADTTGTIQRGEVLDYADGAYSAHAEGGTPSAIVAETTEYAADDTEIVVTVYTSGTFRTSEVTPELTTADVEALRGKGIYLK